MRHNAAAPLLRPSVAVRLRVTPASSCEQVSRCVSIHPASQPLTLAGALVEELIVVLRHLRAGKELRRDARGALLVDVAGKWGVVLQHSGGGGGARRRLSWCYVDKHGEHWRPAALRTFVGNMAFTMEKSSNLVSKGLLMSQKSLPGTAISRFITLLSAGRGESGNQSLRLRVARA